MEPGQQPRGTPETKLLGPAILAWVILWDGYWLVDCALAREIAASVAGRNWNWIIIVSQNDRRLEKTIILINFFNG